MLRHVVSSLWVCSLILLGSAVAVPAHAEIRTGYLMDHDPKIDVPQAVLQVPPRLKTLWIEALARPEADMQRLAADAIARGHAEGIPGLAEAVPRLGTVLTSAESHPSARLAAARALVALNAKTSAAVMAAGALQFGADLRQVIEPVLAEWGYRPMREEWRSRLKEPRVRYRDLALAIRCLSVAGDESAAGVLLEFVHNAEHSIDVRIEAARSVGILVTHGLEEHARLVTSEKKAVSTFHRLCGVLLVARHSGDDARALLKGFAVDTEPAIAVIALTRLIEIDPNLVLPLAEGAMGNADVKVRQAGAKSYFLLPDPSRIAVLARMLNDPNPGLRHSVREWLYELSRVSELDQPIRHSLTEVLAGDDWRGLEQAALLLATLDHKPAAARMVELLDNGRTEVRIAAAWGVKTLAVPETLPASLTAALRRTETRMGTGPINSDLDAQTAHLLELFGKTKYGEAESLLRQYIPKEVIMGRLSRAAAIWSLGHLHEGVPDEALARQLGERLSDDNPFFPELNPIRGMSAVSIARMKAVSQIPILRRYGAPPVAPDEFPMRVRWALMGLTGESIPEPVPPTKGTAGWFLEPIGQ